MFTEKQFAWRFDEIYKFSISPMVTEQKKILRKMVKLLRNATKEQLLTRDPNVLLGVILKLLLHYENLIRMEGLCEWKRRRKFRIAQDCYRTILRSYMPEKSQEILETITKSIYQEQLWKYETFCFNIVYDLLEISVNGIINQFIDAIIIKLKAASEKPTTEVEEESRGILRLLHKLLKTYTWPETEETQETIKTMLNLFWNSIIDLQSKKLHPKQPVSILAKLKKSLELCIRHIVTHLPNYYLLIVIEHICSWSVAPDTTEDIILEFGNIIEYAAYTHETNLYEQTLTPTIFNLLMQMIGSTSRLNNLLGNRVFQYLLDRKDNRVFFDTPKIFFEHMRIDVRIGACLREDLSFFKDNRELLHDNLLRSLVNHCNSRMNLETTYCTVCLIAVEIPSGFTAAAIVCLAMNLQEVILKREDEKIEIICHVHATIISIISLVCWIHKAKVFYDYLNKIVMERAQWAPQFNPPIQSQYDFAVHHVLWDKEELFFVDWETRYGLWKCFRLAK